MLKVRSFGREDGLPSPRVSTGQPCAARASDGQLWFATLKGLALVDPLNVRSNAIPPAVVIEEARVDGVLLAVPDAGAIPSALKPRRIQGLPLRIVPGARRIEFRYTAPNLTSPEGVRFKLRVDGLDDDWQPETSERTIAYHALRAGSYRLRVAAANNDGVWGEDEASLAFIVTPWFWETGWFRVGVAFALVLALGSTFWVRTRTLERRRIAQEEFSTTVDRTSGSRAPTHRRRIARRPGPGSRIGKKSRVARSIGRSEPGKACAAQHGNCRCRRARAGGGSCNLVCLATA